MKNFLYNCLSSNGKVSSKRFITLLAFLFMAVGFIANLFWDLDIDNNIYESMEWIVIGGLGFTASEGFTNRKHTDKDELSDNEPSDDLTDDELAAQIESETKKKC